MDLLTTLKHIELAGIGSALKEQKDKQAIQHAAFNISILLGGSEVVYDLQ